MSCFIRAMVNQSPIRKYTQVFEQTYKKEKGSRCNFMYGLSSHSFMAICFTEITSSPFQTVSQKMIVGVEPTIISKPIIIIQILIYIDVYF